MTDIDKLRALIAAASEGPWEYRPCEHDDWGFIRGPEIEMSYGRGRPIVALSRDNEEGSDHSAHRIAKTDPYERNGRAIVAMRNEIEGLLDELERLRGMSGWRGIESVPKDGASILLWSAHRPDFDVWQDEWSDCMEDGGCWLFCDLWAEPVTPTHWQPLPAPPETGDAS